MTEGEIKYVQSTVLVVILTIYTLFNCADRYNILLLSGALMIIYTVESLSDEGAGGLFVVQIVLSVLFVLAAGNVSAYLIFQRIRFNGKRVFGVLLPAVMYCILNAGGYVPLIILNVLILTAAAFALDMAEQAFNWVVSAKAKSEQTISEIAVKELYEKKLNQQLVVKNYLAERNARLEERENISRNIHNSVGHSITAAVMTLEAADMLFDLEPERAREKMNLANDRIREGLSSIRHAVRVLDSENGFISMEDFITELETSAERFMTDTQLNIRLDCAQADKNTQLLHEHTEFLTGAVQELLTNAVKHGNADKILISVTAGSHYIKISVEDNGKGEFTEETLAFRIENGFGIKKIRSYIEKCGGKFDMKYRNGMCVTMELLISDENAV